MQRNCAIYTLHKISILREKVHTHPISNFLREGVLKVKILEAKYEAKLEFPGERGVQNKKTFRGGSMDVFSNCTMGGGGGGLSGLKS